MSRVADSMFRYKMISSIHILPCRLSRWRVGVLLDERDSLMTYFIIRDASRGFLF